MSEARGERSKGRDLVETTILGLLFVGQIVLCVVFYN